MVCKRRNAGARVRSSSPTRKNLHGSPADPLESAKTAGLKYVDDREPGIRRRRGGKGFRYDSPAGKAIRDPKTLARIKALAIPPAWEDVWICCDPDGHLQATGRDSRRRKQYRYHRRWREVRDVAKYDRLLAFAQVLPKLRRRIRRDLKRKGLPREKALAAVVQLLESTLIRVGNSEYAQANDSFGLTTLRNRHAQVNGSKIRFSFRGKSGVRREVEFHDPRLAKIVRQCQDLPGQELFGYLDDDGQPRDIGSADVNEYLREATGQEFTAKDFRTWAGTALAAQALREFEDFDSQAAAKQNITQAIERVAARLGNTKAVCRKCYIHPVVFDAYLDRSLLEVLQQRTAEELKTALPGLPAEEAAVLALLQQRMEQQLSTRSR
jgi:DNA topoisomerase-1